MTTEYSKKVEIAKKRVGNVKGIDAKKAPKGKVKVAPVGGIKNLTKGLQGAKITYTKKFSKGGMVKSRKGC